MERWWTLGYEADGQEEQNQLYEGENHVTVL